MTCGDLPDDVLAAIRARARELAATAPAPSEDALATLRALLRLDRRPRHPQRPAA